MNPRYNYNQYVNKLIFHVFFAQADTDVAEQVVEDEEVDLRNEVVQFHNNCPNCNAICETNMKITGLF